MLKFEETVLPVKGLTRDIKLYIVSDSHLTLLDEDATAYQQAAKTFIDNCFYRFPQYGQKAFFDMFFEQARKDADVVALTGDIISFPSRANLAALKEALGSLNVPYVYTPGNHDWNWNYFWAVEEALRRDVVLPTQEEAMKPFYELCDPIRQVTELPEVRLIAVDNADKGLHAVAPGQAEWLKAQLSDGKPSLLFVHAPLYQPDLARNVYATQNNFFSFGVPGEVYAASKLTPAKAELSSEVAAFTDAVKSAPNLFGVFAGHIHLSTHTWLTETLPQFTTGGSFGAVARKVILTGA